MPCRHLAGAGSRSRWQALAGSNLGTQAGRWHLAEFQVSKRQAGSSSRQARYPGRQVTVTVTASCSGVQVHCRQAPRPSGKRRQAENLSHCSTQPGRQVVPTLQVVAVQV